MIKSLIKFLRLPNLFIVGLTQYLLLYFLLMPYLKIAGISPSLDYLHFFLFILDTVIITLSGNIINDIKDYKIDQINRPDTVFVSKYISVSNAWKLYWGVVISGFILALYLALHIDKLSLVLIYPTAVAMLYIYSAYSKKQVLVGNLIVSIFCGGVAGIVLFAEKDAYLQLDASLQKQAGLAFLCYGIFAFLTTLFREIVKDIEDVDGDRERGCKTLPIVHGIENAKWFALITGMSIILLVGLIMWLMANQAKDYISWLYPLIFILLPMIYLTFNLNQAKTSSDFKWVSNGTKIVMLTGLIYIFLV